MPVTTTIPTAARAYVHERDFGQVVAAALLADAAWPTPGDVEAMMAAQRAEAAFLEAEDDEIDAYHRELEVDAWLEEAESERAARGDDGRLPDPW